MPADVRQHQEWVPRNYLNIISFEKKFDKVFIRVLREMSNLEKYGEIKWIIISRNSGDTT